MQNLLQFFYLCSSDYSTRVNHTCKYSLATPCFNKLWPPLFDEVVFTRALCKKPCAKALEDIGKKDIDIYALYNR